VPIKERVGIGKSVEKNITDYSITLVWLSIRIESLLGSKLDLFAINGKEFFETSSKVRRNS
jgi:hypothetical protein